MRHPRSARARLARHAVVAPLAAASLLAAVPHAAGAQDRLEQPWERRSRPTLSLEGGGIYSSVGSTGDGALGDGFGFDVQGNVGISALSVGVGYQRSTQQIAGVGDDATYQGIYLEPRLALPLGYGSFTPYVAGRVGRMRVGTPDGVGGSGTGTLLGAGAGVLVSLAPNVQLNLAGLWSHVNVDSPSQAPADGIQLDPTANGVLLRAGMVLGFDRWGR